MENVMKRKRVKTVISHLPTKNRRRVTGSVISDKMDKTIVVRVDRRSLHPLYRKYIVVSKKFRVHDGDNIAKTGDTVRIIESRPISKSKKWRLYQVINSGSAQGDSE